MGLVSVAGDKVFHGYPQGIGYAYRGIGGWYGIMRVEIILDSTFVYSGKRREFFYKHPRIDQLQFQIFLKAHAHS